MSNLALGVHRQDGHTNTAADPRRRRPVRSCRTCGVGGRRALGEPDVLTSPCRTPTATTSSSTAVYKIVNNNEYLLLQEAIGSDGRRWYRSFTSNRVEGPWTPQAATESNPFTRSNNVTFPTGTPAWTRDFSHGEPIRANNDQTLTVNPCRLQFLHQGLDPNASGEYSQLPYRMGLLTQTNSTC